MTTNPKKQIRPEVVDLGERVTATLAAVTEVVKDHHHDHQDSVANRENVEWSSTNVLCSYVEVKIALGMKSTRIKEG